MPQITPHLIAIKSLKKMERKFRELGKACELWRRKSSGATTDDKKTQETNPPSKSPEKTPHFHSFVPGSSPSPLEKKLKLIFLIIFIKRVKCQCFFVLGKAQFRQIWT
jgi:hypothetical protein